MKEKRSPAQKALTLWGAILFVWAIYRAKFQFFPPWFDEFIAKPIVFVFPVYYYIVRFERKNFFSAVSLRFNRLRHDIGSGILIGIPIVGVAVMAYFIKHQNLNAVSKNIVFDANFLFFCLMALATAISEEILSRGFILKRLYQESKNIFTSSFLASMLYFLLHVPVLFTRSEITGSTLLLVMMSTVSLSLVNSFVFLAEGSLLIPILIHAFFNITIFIFL